MIEEPVWDSDGQPENLIAAAMDAYEWLKIINISISYEDKNRYKRCVNALKEQINNYRRMDINI